MFSVDDFPINHSQCFTGFFNQSNCDILETIPYKTKSVRPCCEMFVNKTPFPRHLNNKTQLKKDSLQI